MPNGVHHRQCCVTRETYLTFLLLLYFQSTQLFALKPFKFYLKEFPLVQLDLRDACYAFTLFSIPQLFFYVKHQEDLLVVWSQGVRRRKMRQRQGETGSHLTLWDRGDFDPAAGGNS